MGERGRAPLIKPEHTKNDLVYPCPRININNNNKIVNK